MEGSELERIKRVVDAFERSDWSEIDVRTGDLRVHLAVGAPIEPDRDHRSAGRPAGGRPATSDEPSSAGATVRSTDTADTSDVRPATDRSQTSDHPVEMSEPAVGVEHDGHAVTAPTPGIFWRSPEPGAPPFAEVGDTVESSDTLCIIEVMKLMQHLKAGVRGRIVAVHGENGAAVAKDAPLFTIESAEPDEPVS